MRNQQRIFLSTMMSALLLTKPITSIGEVSISLTIEDEIKISNLENQGSKVNVLVNESSSERDKIGNKAQIITKYHIHKLPFQHEVKVAASATSLEPALIHAVIAAESLHKANALSQKGAIGLMQIMPATAIRFKVRNSKDPQQNILAGSKYLRELLDLYQGNLELSLAAYNAGPRAVQKYNNQIPPFKETQQYVPKVLMYYHQFL